MHKEWFFSGNDAQSNWLGEIRLANGHLYRVYGVSKADVVAQAVETEKRWNLLKIPVGPAP